MRHISILVSGENVARFQDDSDNGGAARRASPWKKCPVMVDLDRSAQLSLLNRSLDVWMVKYIHTGKEVSPQYASRLSCIYGKYSTVYIARRLPQMADSPISL